MENKTTEFSFILKQTKHGVGVFTTQDIRTDTYLRIFGDETITTEVSVARDKKNVPEIFRKYCIDREITVRCPKDFGRMEIGWYVNHSKTPNTYHCDYVYYALRDIKEGEEILIDYNTLEEPEKDKEDYYSK